MRLAKRSGLQCLPSSSRRIAANAAAEGGRIPGGAERSEEVRRREFRSIGDNKTSDKLRNRMHKKRPGQTADGRVRVRY